MTVVRDAVADYLTIRRALGFKLVEHQRLLRDFATFLEQTGASTITTELAVAWAVGCQGTEGWKAARLSVIRGFAAYMRSLDPQTEIPPAGVFAVRYQRQTPYLWSQQDISRLLDATGALRPALKAASYEALFGLLAVTGMRLGEAVALEPDDVDLDNGVITIHAQNAKLERARMVPLHPTTVHALQRYADARARLCPRPRSSTFLLSGVGTGLDRSAVAKTLRTLTTTLGLRTSTIHPTAHQLRHSIAVSTLIDWQRSGAQVDERIAVLSTYLGHVRPAETYWYLTATPDLMGLAADRVDLRFGDRS